MMGGVFEKGKIAIVTELCDKNLAAVLKDESFNLFKRINLSINIAKGVNWLHEAKPPLLHYNLKPENILVKNSTKISRNQINVASKSSPKIAVLVRFVITDLEAFVLKKQFRIGRIFFTDLLKHFRNYLSPLPLMFIVMESL